MGRILRESQVLVVQLTNVLGTTPAISWLSFAGGQVILPATYASTTITVYCAEDANGTFVPLTDSAGNAITVTIGASLAVALPSEVYGAAYLKLVTNADDSTEDVQLIAKG